MFWFRGLFWLEVKQLTISGFLLQVNGFIFKKLSMPPVRSQSAMCTTIAQPTQIKTILRWRGMWCMLKILAWRRMLCTDWAIKRLQSQTSKITTRMFSIDVFVVNKKMFFTRHYRGKSIIILMQGAWHTGSRFLYKSHDILICIKWGPRVFDLLLSNYNKNNIIKMNFNLQFSCTCTSVIIKI